MGIDLLAPLPGEAEDMDVDKAAAGHAEADSKVLFYSIMHCDVLPFPLHQRHAKVFVENMAAVCTKKKWTKKTGKSHAFQAVLD